MWWLSPAFSLPVLQSCSAIKNELRNPDRRVCDPANAQPRTTSFPKRTTRKGFGRLSLLVHAGRSRLWSLSGGAQTTVLIMKNGPAILLLDGSLGFVRFLGHLFGARQLRTVPAAAEGLH